ncbi:MAG: hypothetical protein QXW45_06885 [Thermosphaera sp.]
MAEAEVFKKLADLFPDNPPIVDEDTVVNYIIEKAKEAVQYGSFFDLLISGDQGVGKSTLALYIMFKYYGDRDKVLKNIFFNVDELNETLLNEKREIVLLDDAGVSLSKYRALNEVAVDYYALQQIARTRVSVIIYTTVHDNLAKFIRDIVDVVVVIHTRKGNKSYGAVYRKKRKYFTVVSKKYDFAMNLDKLHSDAVFHNIYVEYNERRERFVRQIVEELLKKKKERDEKEEIDKFEQKIKRLEDEKFMKFMKKVDELKKQYKRE